MKIYREGSAQVPCPAVLGRIRERLSGSSSRAAFVLPCSALKAVRKGHHSGHLRRRVTVRECVVNASHDVRASFVSDLSVVWEGRDLKLIVLR
jgi:hypothetical protein